MSNVTKCASLTNANLDAMIAGTTFTIIYPKIVGIVVIIWSMGFHVFYADC